MNAITGFEPSLERVVSLDSKVVAHPAFAAQAGSRDPLDDVRGIVARTVGRARAMGRDDVTQTRAAAHAVISVRPDLSLTEAINAIGRLRASGAV